MNILLLGKDGQVGWELQRALSLLGSVTMLDRHAADLTNSAQMAECLAKFQPNIIVNAAAYTAVDKAELEADKAYAVNATAVQTLAEEAQRLGAWLVHYSTDYVFDGTKQSAYVEEDYAAPLNAYGDSKLAGENAIRQTGCRHLILRSSWVYSLHGANFPIAILRRAQELDRLEVVNDSFGAPTSAALIADVTTLILSRIIHDQYLANNSSGTYHLVASGKTSWYEYAKLLVSIARKKGLQLKAGENKIFPVSGEHYQSAAKRPKNSLLDNEKIQRHFGISLPPWDFHVERFVDEAVKPKPF